MKLQEMKFKLPNPSHTVGRNPNGASTPFFSTLRLPNGIINIKCLRPNLTEF
jgi:hypothetical protein